MAIDPHQHWLQKGVINDEAKSLAESEGLNVVVDSCPKIEIHWVYIHHLIGIIRGQQ
ncbi:CoA-binding protein [Xenorhabdus koppenhoeferi]|uniref:CoA-binding protein n=1 Tax=Xenorhabdus koppenhoeferi TaxID=351659 RepID=UPI0038CD4469